MKLTIAYVVALIVTIMIPSAFADSISVDIDNISYDIDYTGNSVVLKSVTADLDFISLIFETEVSESGGDVSITFQRDFFDAKFGTEIDDEFFILSDGEEIEFGETKNDESRTLSFSLYAENEQIEIIGTILANNSFLIEQQQKEIDTQAQADAAADKATADKAAADKAAADKAAAEAAAESDAKSKAENDRMLEELKILMDSCGDGTIFENGKCVLSPMEKNATDVDAGPLIYSVVIGLMIGVVITLILWGIGKKSHKVLSDDS